MLEYGLATKDDIEELIQLRIAYMIDDFGSVSEVEKDGMEKQLPSWRNSFLVILKENLELNLSRLLQEITTG